MAKQATSEAIRDAAVLVLLLLLLLSVRFGRGGSRAASAAEPPAVHTVVKSS